MTKIILDYTPEEIAELERKNPGASLDIPIALHVGPWKGATVGGLFKLGLVLAAWTLAGIIGLGLAALTSVYLRSTEPPEAIERRVDMFRKIPELGALRGGEILEFPDGTLELVSARCTGRDICIIASTSWQSPNYYDIDRNLAKLASARIVRPHDVEYAAKVAQFRCFPHC